MITFKKFINESLDPEEILKLIKNDCKSYLKQLTKSDFENERLLQSGRNTNEIFAKKNVRRNRKPKDTPSNIHEWLDNWFYKKFGIKARSQTLFCSSDRFTVSGYGNAFWIFPIGKFEIIWSSVVRDLYNKADFNRPFEDYKKIFLDFQADSYQKGNLSKALKDENEIMLFCKDYYMLNKGKIENHYIINDLKDSL